MSPMKPYLLTIRGDSIVIQILKKAESIDRICENEDVVVDKIQGGEYLDIATVSLSDPGGCVATFHEGWLDEIGNKHLSDLSSAIANAYQDLMEYKHLREDEDSDD